jgi:endoribonuclease LACTB2
MNIVNVGYDSTNYYVLADSSPKLLIDVGFPGTLPKLQSQCKRMGIDLSKLKHFLLTHYHPDHAGLAEELKRTGIKLIVMESQLEFVPAMRAYMKPQQHYFEIDLSDAITLTFAESRAFLGKLGLQGEIISTPGHSDDSVSLILDEGIAFTGDLSLPMTEDPMDTVRQSWEKIRALGVKTIYPGHGPIRQLL